MPKISSSQKISLHKSVNTCDSAKNDNENFLNKILYGDCEAMLKRIPDNSIDLIVTDPPYGLNLMGKDWDKVVPPVSKWKECLRVLKHGAFAFVFCIPRQDCLARMIVNLQDAGFKTGFTSLFWVQAQGFPKAENIAKAADKKLGIKPIEIKDSEGVGFMKPDNTDWNETKHHITMPPPTTSEAKALEGAFGGFNPKPALEVILVVMKPLSEPTYLAQAMKDGKGCIWL